MTLIPDLCPLCGDSLCGLAGVDGSYRRRSVYRRLPNGPWLACADGMTSGNRTVILTKQLETAEFVRTRYDPDFDVLLRVEPLSIEWRTAHATCAQPLVDAANAREAAAR